MGLVDPATLGGIGAMIFGILLVASGFHVRRRRRLHTRQGAEVLAGLAIVMGLGAIGAGALYLAGI